MDQLYYAPLIFITSCLTYLSSSKLIIEKKIFHAITGGSLIGFSLVGLNPSIQYESFYISLCTVCSTIFFFILNMLSSHHNTKHLSLVTNLTHNSIYGLFYGFILSYTSGLEFIQYIVSLLLCNFTTSYSLGIQYIEYSKYLPLLYSLSLPLGLVIGNFIDFENLNLLHAVSFGALFMSGSKHIIDSLTKSNNDLYLQDQSNINYRILCFIVFGVIISCLIQSPLLTNINEVVNSTTNINEFVRNSTNITELVSNSTNITELVGNSTNITGL